MMRSVGVAVLLGILGVTKYVESSCVFETTLNARTERNMQLFYTDGEQALTTCFDGYATDQLLRQFTRTCTAGTWLPAWQCNPITCTGLPVVEGADILFLSEVDVVDNLYPVNSEALILCSPGMSTDRGRTRYPTTCSYSSTWNDTSPCTVPVNQLPVQSNAFQVQLTVTSLSFTSSQDQGLADSLSRALFTVFEAEFGGSYIGSEDFSFSVAPQGVNVDFTMLFLPSVTFEPNVLRQRIASALSRVNFQASDPTRDTTYTFLGTLDVSQEPVSQFSRGATIGLSIGGALLAILAFTIIILCCCCRQTKPVPGFNRRQGHPAPVMAPLGPPPAIPSPYAQLGDVPYSLPRNFP